MTVPGSPAGNLPASWWRRCPNCWSAVQQQQVGTAEQSLGQQDFHQTGVHIGHLGLVPHAYAQALQDTTGIALGFPAAQLCVLFLQFTGAHTVFVGHFLPLAYSASFSLPMSYRRWLPMMTVSITE